MTGFPISFMVVPNLLTSWFPELLKQLISSRVTWNKTTGMVHCKSAELLKWLFVQCALCSQQQQTSFLLCYCSVALQNWADLIKYKLNMRSRSDIAVNLVLLHKVKASRTTFDDLFCWKSNILNSLVTSAKESNWILWTRISMGDEITQLFTVLLNIYLNLYNQEKVYFLWILFTNCLNVRLMWDKIMKFRG